jgi:hypothetical protein
VTQNVAIFGDLGEGPSSSDRRREIGSGLCIREITLGFQVRS